jgi:hypothetical protein
MDLSEKERLIIHLAFESFRKGLGDQMIIQGIAGPATVIIPKDVLDLRTKLMKIEGSWE